MEGIKILNRILVLIAKQLIIFEGGLRVPFVYTMKKQGTLHLTS